MQSQTRKATREQLKRHNRQLLLRAVYTGLADNRAALALETGLAKPTVSDLVAEMIEDGLLEESGRGESTDSGGKRPTLLRFMPDVRQVIGVSLEGGRICGVLANLAGQVTAEHYVDLSPAAASSQEQVIRLLGYALNGLIAQLDAPLLCIGVGVPGLVDTYAGVVQQAGVFGWKDLPLGEALHKQYDVPIYLGNSAELTALAQFAFGLNGDAGHTHSLVTVHVDESITIGVTQERMAFHHGTDLSAMRIPHAESGFRRIDSILSWSAVERRTLDLRRMYPGSHLPDTHLTYLHLRHGTANGDTVALRVYDELSAALAQVFGWVIAVIRPNHISLAGGIAVLGERFLATVVQKIAAYLPAEEIASTTFSLAYSDNLSAIGAAALALQREVGIV